MSDVTSQNFAQEVIETSRQVPVLVDFWAPWCGPCRTLGPMLEKLEHEYAGKWKLAKVNSDESPELSAHFNVRSIPHVVAFVDGKPVDQFVGVLPESQLRGFLDRVIPQPAEVAYREGLAAHQANALAHAREAFQNALAYDPGFDAARFALIDLLLDTGDVRAAQNEFALLSSRAPQDERHARCRPASRPPSTPAPCPMPMRCTGASPPRRTTCRPAWTWRSSTSPARTTRPRSNSCSPSSSATARSAMTSAARPWSRYSI